MAFSPDHRSASPKLNAKQTPRRFLERMKPRSRSSMKTPLKHDPRQPTFDWQRGEQLALLRDVRLMRVAGVSQVTLKAVLRSIDDHARRGGECWATQETLQAEIGASNVRTVKRAIAALLAASLITCERRKIPGAQRLTVNHYRIVWNELALLRDRPAEAISAPIKVTCATEQSDMLSDQSDINDRSTGHGCHLPRSEKKRDRTATSNGARQEEAEGQEIFQQQMQEPIMAKRPTRKIPEDRPILAADYAAAPTEHRSSFPRSDKRHDVPGAWSIYEQQRVEDAFRAAGHGGARLLVETAMSRGLQPADCDAVVEQLHGSVDAKERKPLNAGALDWRIKQGSWPCNLIAKVDLEQAAAAETPAVDQDLAEQRKHAARRAENERLRQLRDENTRRELERAARLGPLLDALPEADLAALIERLPIKRDNPIAARELAKRPITFEMFRRELFLLLESEATD